MARMRQLYYFSAGSTVRCMWDAPFVLFIKICVWVFSHSEPLIDCPRPHGIANGQWAVQGGYSYSSFHSHTRVLYSCSPSYKLIGSAVIECLPDGKWSDLPPVCRALEVSCPKPADITNGRVAIHGGAMRFGYGVHTKAEYSCQPHFRLVGTPVIWCLDTGAWSDTFPYCTPKDTHEGSRTAT